MLAIFDAINSLAAALKMSITVEGVEKEQQIEILRQRFVGTIQGYYYSEAKPAARITDQIRAVQVGRSTEWSRLALEPASSC